MPSQGETDAYPCRLGRAWLFPRLGMFFHTGLLLFKSFLSFGILSELFGTCRTLLDVVGCYWNSSDFYKKEDAIFADVATQYLSLIFMNQKIIPKGI